MVELRNSSTLSTAQALSLAARAGFPADQLVTAVAVAKAESGLNPRAKNDNPGTGDYSIGLWQINMRAHGNTYGTEEQLKNPATNARAAVAIFRAAGNRWSPWGAYTNGSYREHLATVAAVAKGGGAAAAVESLSSSDFQMFRSSIDSIGDIPAPWEIPGEAADLVGDFVTGAAAEVFQLDEIFAQFLVMGVTVVFSAAALAIIALGLFRLTGTNPRDIFSVASTATGAGGVVKAIT